ncbi:hypothetical protein BC629DRAFT_291243 [Irpex lacteus]|nr:hypothetical protein BC629DRAFT_291243 [Irpex lacteus]
MSRGEPTDVITITTSKPKLSDFPEELICAIIHEVDGTDIDSSWRQWMIQLKSCALVARKWRRGAQQLIHRVVCIDDETSDPVRFLKLYSNDRTAIKNEQARSSNGQIWRFPKILIIRSAPPQGFSSWLEIPEFQAFAEQCAKNVTRLDVAWNRHEIHQLDDILQYILRFPAVKSSKVDCWWRLASSAPCKRPVPRQLERMELQHTIGNCLPSKCEMHAFAAWLQGSDVKVSLDYDFPILKHEWSHCNVLNTIGANIQELSLHGWLAKMPFKVRMLLLVLGLILQHLQEPHDIR